MWRYLGMIGHFPIRMPIRTWLLPTLLVLLAAYDTYEQDLNPGRCDPGRWGLNCEECHCLNGAEQCDQSDGTCRDETCSRGWKDPPLCQTGDS